MELSGLIKTAERHVTGCRLHEGAPNIDRASQSVSTVGSFWGGAGNEESWSLTRRSTSSAEDVYCRTRGIDSHRPLGSATETWGYNNSNNEGKKNQLDVTFCILYLSCNSCSTCFGQPCAHHQELTIVWCYSLVLVCAVAAGRLSRPVGR